MGDVCLRATHKEARLEIAVALTTDLVREAKRIHGLAATSAVALGRLLTGTALLALTRKEEGSTSAQVLSKSRIGSLFADCTSDGAARGMARVPHLAFPMTHEERESGRRSLAAAVFPGQVSVIRRVSSGEYAQSSVPLVSGEIDEDLAHYLERSDQTPTLLICDVLLEPSGEVLRAGGVLIHAMPDGDRTRMRPIDLAHALSTFETAEALLSFVSKDAQQVDAPVYLRYECRCSRGRVLASLRMFGVKDLVEMVSAEESVEVACDLCGKKYRVEPDELRRAFEDLIKAEG